jgi:hypothetical protein
MQLEIPTYFECSEEKMGPGMICAAEVTVLEGQFTMISKLLISLIHLKMTQQLHKPLGDL